jgi:hypothetical protein
MDVKEYEDKLRESYGFIASMSVTEDDYDYFLKRNGIPYKTRTIENVYCGETFASPTEIEYEKEGQPRYAYQFQFGSIDSYVSDILVFDRKIPDKEIVEIFLMWNDANLESLRKMPCKKINPIQN